MKERVSAISGGAIEGMPWLGTFHSVAARMLRSHAELVGLQSNFTILDTDDQLRLLKQLILAANLDEKRWPARQLAGLIDRWKNRGLTPPMLDAAESEAFAQGRGQEFYAAYQARLRTLNACDFGDLLLHMLTIFKALSLNPAKLAGLEPGADLKPDRWEIGPDGLGVIEIAGVTIRPPVRGLHNLRNAMLALAVARECGVSYEDAAAGIALVSQPKMRVAWEQLGNVTLHVAPRRVAIFNGVNPLG